MEDKNKEEGKMKLVVAFMNFENIVNADLNVCDEFMMKTSFTSCIRQFEEALEEDNDLGEANMYIAECYMNNMEYEKGINHAKEALKKFEAGCSLVTKGSIKDCKAYTYKIIAMIHIYRAHDYFNEGNFEKMNESHKESLKCFQKAIENNPEDIRLKMLYEHFKTTINFPR
ncbi:MAG TPA: hypothetical protein ENN73_00080 [Firmicutes bacterium]|nr:hypothetical protein [Bacillota bacterium]